jgi:Rrf2 family protein
MNFAITRRGEYGLTAVLYLANRPAGELTQIHEVAESCSLPEPFLAQILRLLVRAGLVVSKKGVRGGFSLSRPSSEISFLEVLEALEGPVAVNKCQSPVERCAKEGCCSMEGIWSRAQDALVDVLRKASIAEAMCMHQFPFVTAAVAMGESNATS